MVNEANMYLEDGEYTREGLKVITTFINGGVLDENTSQEFCYEVANNYFEVQKDYGTAKTYFQRLDENIYPDARYYIDLCNEMREFTDNDKRVMELMSIEMDKGENNGKS